MTLFPFNPLPVQHQPFFRRNSARPSSLQLPLWPSASPAPMPPSVRFGMLKNFITLKILKPEVKQRKKDIKTIREMIHAIKAYAENTNFETGPRAVDKIALFVPLSESLKIKAEDRKKHGLSDEDIQYILNLGEEKFPHIPKLYPAYVDVLKKKLNNITLNLPEGQFIKEKIIVLPDKSKTFYNSSFVNQHQLTQKTIEDSIRLELVRQNPKLAKNSQELEAQIEARLLELAMEDSEKNGSSSYSSPSSSNSTNININSELEDKKGKKKIG